MIRQRMKLESRLASLPIIEIREETGEGPLVLAPRDRVENGRPVISLPHLFNARPYQRRYLAYFDRGGKRAFVVWHRRAGKDLTDLHATAKMAVNHGGVYWHTLPTEAQARKALWNGATREGLPIMELVFPRSLRESPREWSINASMVVKLKSGSIVQLVGSDNVSSLLSAGPRHVTFSEYALCHPTAWPLIQPMLKENDGSASFLTTPKGKNHAWKLWKMAQGNPEWFTESVNIYESGAFPDPDAVLEEERRDGMPEALIESEYLCSWDAALVGSVYGDLLTALDKRGGMEPFEHDRGRTYVAWDLGFSDSTALLLFQVHGEEIRFVDHYEKNHEALSHYTDWLAMRGRQMGYEYAVQFLPHDAAPGTLATGMGILEQLRQHYRGSGTQLVLVPKLSPEDGIQAARKLLQEKVRFHPRCAEALELIRAYSYAFDEEKKVYSNKPAHDFSSHTSDAFRYAAVMSAIVIRAEKARVPQPPKPVKDGWTLDELWKDHDSQRSSGGRIRI